jgi:very-short-patch-repair endonuclease
MNLDDLEKKTREESFYSFFRTLKEYSIDERFKNDKERMSKELFEMFKGDKKREIIIFTPNKERLDKITIKKRQIKFPFDKIFLEYPIIKRISEDSIIICSGFLFFKPKEENKKNIMMCSIAYTFYKKENDDYLQYGQSISHLAFREEEIFELNDNPEHHYAEIENFRPTEYFFLQIKEVIQKFVYTIEKKEYTSYKKWTPSGLIEKEIVYSYDRAGHKRHFWKDSGKFRLLDLPHEELIKKGYGIDEIVFRNNELRRDVPFKFINQTKVGDKKDNQTNKIENRRIYLLGKKNLRIENKIFDILKQIFPDKLIRRHDRITLKGLELDFNIPELKIAIEYDGEQHFDKELYKKIYGEGFEAQVKRDKLKNKLCSKKNIKLIRIKYNEDISKRNIKKKLLPFIY